MVCVCGKGHAFRQQDWDRLKKIAEGNPDENKIGFFGVGFYSVFSICEEPIIMSGNKCMGFYWKGDQLYISKMENVKERDDKIRDLYEEFSTSYSEGGVKTQSKGPKDDWTVFVMDPRDAFKVENVESFGLFLCKCIGFTKSLAHISIAINSNVIMSLGKELLQKTLLPIERLDPWKGGIAKGLMGGVFGSKHLVSPNGIFVLHEITMQKMLISIKTWGNDGTSSHDEDKIEMSVACGNVKVQIAEDFAQRMLRVTKKRPPKETTVQLMFALHSMGLMSKRMACDNENSSTSLRFKNFKNVLYPYPFGGRVFIGFPTHQTTGSSFHVACHVIPTVERESIDFIDADIGIWNQEILSIPGIMSRFLFENFMNSLNEKITAALPKPNRDKLCICPQMSFKIEEEDGAKEKMNDTVRCFEKEAVFAVESLLSSKKTSPIEQVGSILHESFFSRLGGSVPDAGPRVLTSHGIVPSTRARLPKEGVERFIKEAAPMISCYAYEHCKEFYDNDLLSRGLIKHVTFDDLLEEVKVTVFELKEWVELVRWWIALKKKYHGPKNKKAMNMMNKALFSYLSVRFEVSGESKSITMNAFGMFIDPKMIPFNKYSELQSLVPTYCMPLELSTQFNTQEILSLG